MRSVQQQEQEQEQQQQQQEQEQEQQQQPPPPHFALPLFFPDHPSNKQNEIPNHLPWIRFVG